MLHNYCWWFETTFSMLYWYPSQFEVASLSQLEVIEKSQGTLTVSRTWLRGWRAGGETIGTWSVWDVSSQCPFLQKLMCFGHHQIIEEFCNKAWHLSDKPIVSRAEFAEVTQYPFVVFVPRQQTFDWPRVYHGCCHPSNGWFNRECHSNMSFMNML